MSCRGLTGSDETWTLRLRRGDALGRAGTREAPGPGDGPGTTVFISELDTEAARVLTQRKVVDYLRRRRGQAIAAGAYTIEVVEGRTGELVTPDEPDGLPIPVPAHDTLWGKLEFALYVAADVDSHRRTSPWSGRAGTTIIDDLSRARGVRPRAVDQRAPVRPSVVRAVAAVGRPARGAPRRRDLPGVP